MSIGHTPAWCGWPLSGITLDLLANICDQLAEHLPRLSDPDMALNNLDRFVAAARNPLVAGHAVRARSRSAADPAADLLHQPVSQRSAGHRSRSVRPAADDRRAAGRARRAGRRTVRRSRGAERRAHRDDRACAASSAAKRCGSPTATSSAASGWKSSPAKFRIWPTPFSKRPFASPAAHWKQKRGVPRSADGQPARFVVLAMGKLGGVRAELFQRHRPDLSLRRRRRRPTASGRMANVEFFDRLARDVVKLLTEPTDLGAAYRVDLRLRPEGQRGPMVPSLESALHYYDVSGRTWERQAFVKARPAAGDLDFGQEFLAAARTVDLSPLPEPGRHHRHQGPQAPHRAAREQRRGRSAQRQNRPRRHSRHRVRDPVSATAQRRRSAGAAHRQHAGSDRQAGKRRLPDAPGTDRFWKRTTPSCARSSIGCRSCSICKRTCCPRSTQELRQLAIRMGYADAPQAAGARRVHDRLPAEDGAEPQDSRPLAARRLRRRRHAGAGGRSGARPRSASRRKSPRCWAAIRFTTSQAAYQNLMTLSQERIRFLSTRRCRHFLASIAPRLLPAIAATPDPDQTLVNLSKVSDSLGGKGVLWELFSFNPPSLHLYVELCASSPYLSSILISNPGMIDELMDSLVLDKLPTRETLEANLAELSPRRRRSRPDFAQLQKRASAARRRARHSGQGRHRRHVQRAGRHRRSLPAADHAHRIRQAGRPSSASR